MLTQPITNNIFKNFNTTIQQPKAQTVSKPYKLIKEFCNGFVLPDENKNYSQFDEELAKKIASYKDDAIKPITNMLKTSDKERDITAGLLLLNRLYDEGATKDWKIYPEISKFNYSKSPNIQVMLAGIYRKIQVPDAFGPLMTMFWDNAQQKITHPFDPNEEIGGAILEYLRNTSSASVYKH